MKPAEIRFSLQRPLQHRDPAMAPTVTAKMKNSQEHLTRTHELTKPLVEKKRRKRTMRSREQLRSLLSPEFLKQQPDSKLEKAEILEMTACFLRQVQQQQHHHHRAVASRATPHVCNKRSPSCPERNCKTQPQRNLLNHINLRKPDFPPLSCTVQISITKDKSPVNSAPWRPW